jgi:hypothetical protein
MKIIASVTRSCRILLVLIGCSAACTAAAADLSQPVTLVRNATPRKFGVQGDGAPRRTNGKRDAHRVSLSIGRPT